MSKKKMNIILIPSVILIWILVLYRIFSITGAVTNQPDTSALLSETADNNISSYDTDELLLNYRDPFGSIDYFIRERNDFEPEPFSFIEEIAPQEVIIPSIKYIGLVEKDNKSNGVALIMINNRSCLLQEGETFSEVTIKKIDKNFIVVEHNKKPLTYFK